MRRRGLPDPLLVISDGAPGLIRAIEECFPRSARQRCLAHQLRNLQSEGPEDQWPEFKARAIACYQAASPALARMLRDDIAATYGAALPSARWHVCRTTLKRALPICVSHSRKRFFLTEMTIAKIAVRPFFVRPRRGPFFRPGNRSRSRRAQGQSRLAAFAATARLGLDRPEHGGTLAWNGIAFLAWLELPVSGDYGRPARVTSWRSVTCRLQASPDCLFCPAELRHPRAGFWPPWFPLRHKSFVASLRLGGNQHLAVA
jgi:hypothetical protein